MSAFENFTAEAARLELELQRKGIALNIDWDDEQQLRLLARDALDCKPAQVDCGLEDPEQAVRFELFGIAHLMLQVMEESAEVDMHTHGGPCWKAFARALWAEYGARKVLQELGANGTA
jgi:hypothetical protein